MTLLGVATVFVQDRTAWCQVDCLSGVLRVGDQLTGVVRPDHSARPIALTVEAIDLPTGPSWELGTHQTGRVRLSGTGVEAIQVGSSVGTASEGAPGARPISGGPRQMAWRTLDEEERPKLVFEQPGRLSRVSTAFRLVLAIPHVVVLWALGVGAYVVVIIGWFGALVTGRLPQWAGEFLENFVQYQARVSGYVYLLTDTYPPFALSAVPYPIHLLLPPRGKLNRAAVLFRGFLLVPAAVMSWLVLIGWGVASIVIWLIVLITGRYPVPLYQSATAVVRFALRYLAYAFMLTSRYPRGLFGGEPGDEEYPIALSRDLEAAPAVAGSATERLDLSKGAKSLLVGFMILGVVGFIGDVKLNAYANRLNNHNDAVSELNDARHALSVDLQTYEADTPACQDKPDRLACLEGTAEAVADGFDAFRARLDDIDPPDSTGSLFAQVSSTTAACATGFHELAHAQSLDDYVNRSDTLDLQSRGRALDDAYAALVAKLNS